MLKLQRAASLLAAGAVLACSACSALAQEKLTSPIPFKRDAAAGEIDLVRLGIGLVVCALLALAAAYTIRRRFGIASHASTSPKQVTIIETHRLNPKAMLYVVEFSGTRYLLAYSERGVDCVGSTAVAREAGYPG